MDLKGGHVRSCPLPSASGKWGSIANPPAFSNDGQTHWSGQNPAARSAPTPWVQHKFSSQSNLRFSSRITQCRTSYTQRNQISRFDLKLQRYPTAYSPLSQGTLFRLLMTAYLVTSLGNQSSTRCVRIYYNIWQTTSAMSQQLVWSSSCVLNSRWGGQNLAYWLSELTNHITSL